MDSVTSVQQKRTAIKSSIRLELTPECEIASFANLTSVMRNPNEVTLTFLQIIAPLDDNSPQVPARSVARVVLTPEAAKQLLEALSVGAASE